jgi:hypothetical protein
VAVEALATGLAALEVLATVLVTALVTVLFCTAP